MRGLASTCVKQCGVATLATALAILLLGTLVSFSLARAVLMEQKVANNGVRAAQAFEAAEAGLHAAFDYLDEDPDRDGDGNIDPVFDTNGDGIGDAGTASVGSGSMEVAARDLSTLDLSARYPSAQELYGSLTRIGVTALGYSDDRSARRSLSQTFARLDPVPHLPRSPLILGGALAVSGHMNVRNPQGLDAAWTGGDVRVDTGGTFSASVPDTTHAAYPQCLSLQDGCPLGPAADVGASTGIVLNDPALGALTAEEAFRAVFGFSSATFAAAMVTRATSPATFARDVQLAGREVIRVDGDVTLGDVTIGCKVLLTGNASCAGDSRRPVVLVIAGNVEFAGDAHLFGLLFVTGIATVTGSAHVHGALIVAGNLRVDAGAELDVRFDAATLAELREAGPMAPLAGSWTEL